MANPIPSPGQRVLTLDLCSVQKRGAHAVRVHPWSTDDPILARIGSWSGPALALALLAERVRANGERDLPFLVAVGEGVRRGLPTAARASVIARAPLSGRIGQGQVGGDLGARLAGIADVLVIEGRTELAGAVLVIDEGARVELCSRPELAGATPAETHTRLVELYGPCASLRVGPAGERGVPYANLASGALPQSFVGRGGLGAALAAHGLKALVIRAPPAAATLSMHEGLPKEAELARRLRASPRLAARSAGGTLELATAMAARGALALHSGREALGVSAGARLELEGETLARGRHGCRGCPTPCGWVFEDKSGAERGGRFSALHPFVALLASSSLADAFELLDACDRLGLDAKEAGAALGVLERARELGRAEGTMKHGDVRALVGELDSLLEPESTAGAELARGAAWLARRYGLEAESQLAAGEAVRPDTDLAALLGQCAGARGPEPMKSFPFSTAAGASLGRLAELVAPLTLPAGAEDPRSPAGKGRLVWWHENLATAVDATGFCAFSAAALLADGLATLDELAEWIAPWSTDRELGATPGRALCAAGASLVVVQLELEERLGFVRAGPPSWAAHELARPGMLAEYERARGLETGQVDRSLGPALASEDVLAWTEKRFASEAAPGVGRAHPLSEARLLPRTPGHVVLASFGALAKSLGAELELDLVLPASLREVFSIAAGRQPQAERWLLRGADLVPAVYRRGERLCAEDWVQTGDRLELVVAIAGG